MYWVKGNRTDRPLSKRGFNKQPFAVFRWATTANDAYGRGPCMDALGDSKQVQTETFRKAEFLEKGVRPPMGAEPKLKNEPASIMPSMITYMSTAGGKKGLWPLFEVNPAWLQWLTADIAQVNARINTCLFVDLFMATPVWEGVQPRNDLQLDEAGFGTAAGAGSRLRSQRGWTRPHDPAYALYHGTARHAGPDLHRRCAACR